MGRRSTTRAIARVRRGALPFYGNAFIGRENEIAAIDALFAQGEHLVTLVGPGGIGKTRLALAYASQSARAGSAIFCDVSASRDRGALSCAIAQSLGMPVARAGSTDAILEQLGRVLAEQGSGLLVLDNTEQVVDDAASVVALLLDCARDLRVLVTSRERLRLRSEIVFEVPPLGLPESGSNGTSAALELLLDRVRRLGGDATLNASTGESASDLVRRLEGIPLSIELAAARVGAAGFAALGDAASLTVLTHADRGVPDRQRTLHATVAWSWELLAPSERFVLARCAVFPTSFTLRAIEHVAQGPARVLDAMQSLRDKSLVRVVSADVGAERRFALYSTIREFAEEKLRESGDAARAERAHALYFAREAAAHAEAVHGPGVASALDALDNERENLGVAVVRLEAGARRDPECANAALEILHALALLAVRRGPAAPVIPLLDATLASSAACAKSNPALRARALCSRGELYARLGRFAEAEADQQASVVLARSHGDAGLAAQCLFSLGLSQFRGTRRDAARACWTEALSLLGGNRRYEGMVHWGLAAIALEQFESSIAVSEYEFAIRAFEETGYLHGVSVAYEGLGLAWLSLDRADDARFCFGRAVALSRELREPIAEAAAILGLGTVAHVQGQLEHAAGRYEWALSEARAMGDRRIENVAKTYLGALRLEQGDLRAARELLGNAVEWHRASGDPAFEALCIALLAAAESALGWIDAASASFATAMALVSNLATAERHPIELLSGTCDIARATRAERDGDAALAQSLYAQARSRIAAERQHAAKSIDAPTVRSTELRIAERVLSRALAVRGIEDEPTHAVIDTGVLHVHFEGHWFELPSGRRVACHTRKAVRRILVRLVEAHASSPGRSVAPETLIEAGWPGERMLVEAGKNRLKFTLSTLRSLGLRDLLLADGVGYLLDPRVPVRIVDPANA